MVPIRRKLFDDIDRIIAVMSGDNCVCVRVCVCVSWGV